MSGISKIVEIISDKQKKGKIGKRDIYFRGQRTKDVLVPSLLRNKLDAVIENNLYCDCKIMGGMDFGNLKSSWESLAMFQHYGIPTRLLDWSSTLISALFFSMSRCISCKRKGCAKLLASCRGNPCIWILDPTKMHNKLYPRSKYKSFSIGIDKIDEYDDHFIKNQKQDKWKYTKGPIFIDVPWTNPRIRSQKGYFTFHPNDTPLEKIIDEESGLVRIELNRKMRNLVLEELEIIGITEHDIYPDLVSLSKYLKRRYSV